MLWESRFWKDDLLRYADRLERARKSRRPFADSTYVSVEKSVVLGLFIVRKLMDSHKLSVSTTEMRLRAMRYAGTGERVTLMNNHRLDELFDFTKGVRDSVPLRFVCNQSIHSYILGAYAARDGSGLAGIYVTSDKQRHRAVFAVPLREVQRAFRRAGRDYPAFSHYAFDPAVGDYVATVLSKAPADHRRSGAQGPASNRSRSRARS